MDGIAVELGLLYGVRLPHSVFFPLYFADQNFKDPDRSRYVAAIKKFKPEWATVIDIDTPSLFCEALSWAEEISPFVGGLILIPKIRGIIPDIPKSIQGKPVRLGYSVPTKYGKTDVPIAEFQDRPIHLLGGTPRRQFNLVDRMNVVSLDCNFISLKATQFGEWLDLDMGWHKYKESGRKRGYLVCFLLSCLSLLEIYRLHTKQGAKQLSLF